MIVIRSIRCRNFKGLSDVELRLPQNGCFLIHGPNEAGKTSLMDAVRFTLTGLTPAGVTRHSLVRSGRDEAFIRLELAGDRHSLEIERAVSRSGAGRISMSMDSGIGRTTIDSEADAYAGIERLAGLAADDIAESCFIQFDGPGANGDRRGIGYRRAGSPPRRRELGLVGENFGDTSDLEESLNTAKEWLELSNNGLRLESASNSLADTNRRLDLARVRRAQIDFASAEARLSSARRTASDLERTRAALRDDLKAAEEWSASVALVHALSGSSNALGEARTNIDWIRAEIAALESAAADLPDVEKIQARNPESPKILPRQSQNEPEHHGSAHVAPPGEGPAVSTAARGAKHEPERNGIRPNDGREAPGISTGVLVASGTGLVALLTGVAMFIGGNGVAGSTVVPATALLAASSGLFGYALYSTVTIRRRVAQAPGADEPPRPEESWIFDAKAAGARTSEESPLPKESTVEEATRQDDAPSRPEGSEPEPRLEREAPSGATLAAGDPNTVETFPAANESSVTAGLLRLEEELAKAVARERRTRENMEQQVNRLRELRPDLPVADAPDAEILEALVNANESPNDPVALGRHLAEVSARISALEPRLEESTVAFDAASKDLAAAAESAGVHLGPTDGVEAIREALPELRGYHGNEESQLSAEIESLRSHSASIRLEIESQETIAGIGLQDLSQEKLEHEVRRLEHEIKIQRHAEHLATRADVRLVQDSKARALQVARNLLPSFVDKRYFDLRTGPNGETELWDENGMSWMRVTGASAGLRIQIDLVLRLAASITALTPPAAGTPGFVFIDDPVSMSDPSRRQGIVERLTSDKVRETFRQVFVMVTSGTVDQNMFDHEIRLENGTVLSTSLLRTARSIPRPVGIGG